MLARAITSGRDWKLEMSPISRASTSMILGRVQPDFPCYGTFLNGENIYKVRLSRQGFIVMGNEGSGIRSEIEQLIQCKLTIPSFAHNAYSTESLNVGVATGIILSEFKRNTE